MPKCCRFRSCPLYHERMTLAVPDPPSRRYRTSTGTQIKLGGPGELHLAWSILAGNAPEAAAALVDVAVNGTVPGARVAAAKTLLEMTGFKSPDTVQVLPPEHDQAAAVIAGDSPTARIHNRLAALRAERDAPPDAPTMEDLRPDGSEVIDAEVVEPDQG